MSNLIYLTDHELAVVLANLKGSPLPTQAGPVWRKIVRQVGHGELVGGEYDPNTPTPHIDAFAKAYAKETQPDLPPEFSDPDYASRVAQADEQDYDPNAQAESRQGEPK